MYKEYTLTEKAYICLDCIEGISARRKHKIMALMSSAEAIFTEYKGKRAEIEAIAGAEAFTKLEAGLDIDLTERSVNELDKLGIIAVTYISDEYPDTMKEIEPPPLVLYCKGDVGLLKSKGIAIVGTRSCSRYGRDVTEKFATDLVKAGFTVISGMARGVDGIAHTTALNLSGKTIAVLASGVEHVYPPEHLDMYKKIEETGLIVSEYKVGVPPNGYQFPERNRIISGLSQGVIVTEAGEKSGALITLNYANEQGKRVYVVPGNITSNLSKGCNKWLKECQGALVTDVNDILIDFEMPAVEQMGIEDIELDFTEEKIVLELTKCGELHFDEILALTGLDVPSLSALLTRMEICGLVKRLNGNIFTI